MIYRKIFIITCLIIIAGCTTLITESVIRLGYDKKLESVYFIKYSKDGEATALLREINSSLLSKLSGRGVKVKFHVFSRPCKSPPARMNTCSAG